MSFTFKTPYDSGLLTLARREDVRGYLAVGLVDGQLLAALHGPDAADVMDVGAVAPEATHRVDVNLQGTLLNVSLDHVTVTSELRSPATFKDIYFGGVYSFFAPLFHTLNITESFVGCVTDAYVNDRAVEFAREESYGQRPGCCPNPTRVSWCFSSNSTFSLRTGLQHERFSEQLVISFLLRTEADMGMVLLSLTQSNLVSVELYDGSLYLHVNSLVVRCPGWVSDGSWHSLQMAVTLSGLVCQVDGAVNSTSAPRDTIPSLSSPYHVGMASVQADVVTRDLGRLNLSPVNVGMQLIFPSFLGCLKHFQLSGIDLVPSELNEFSPNVSEPCLPVTEPPLLTSTPTPPPPLTVENCPILEYRGLLGDVVLETRPLTVMEGSKGTLTQSTLHFPSLQALPEEVQLALESTIVFHVVKEPVDGVLARVLGSRTSSFSYQEVKSRNIIYRHFGAENELDSVCLEASFECNGQEVNSTAPSVLSFVIELFNDPPSILRQKELTIAVGTRRVITSDVITMTDEDSSGPEKINFHVESIDTCHQCCHECPQEKAGRIERAKAPGIEHVYFTQEDVNNGDIAFQHFASFGTATVRIYLSVTDDNVGSTNIDIIVNPYEGHINLTANTCLFVVEGTAEILQPRHLNAITDFEDQNPTLTYDVVHPASHGRLEKIWQVQPHNVSTWQWLPIDESEHENSFTKEDVTSGYVRYVHDSRQPVATSDRFQFQVRSTNLTGPEGEFCIRVIPYETLQRPNLVVDVGAIVVAEGGTVVVDEAVLRTRLSPPILIDWLEESIGIEQLGIVFVVPPAHGPLSGELLVDGLALQNDSFSLVELLQGRVSYAHNGSEVHSDSFHFYAEARVTEGLPIRPPQPTGVLPVSVSVIPVNDHAPEIQQDVVIAPSEGGFVVITPEMLRVTDEDLPGDQVIIYIRKKGLEYPTGIFVFSSNKNVEVKSFTMDDIYEGRLRFEHTLNSSAPLGYSQYLRVEDGNYTTRGSVAVEAVPLTLNVSTRPIPTCLDATSSQLTLTISPDLVQIVLQDKDGRDPNQLSSIEIVVARRPEYGVIQVSNDSEVAQFSYSVFESAKIVYNFTDHIADTAADSFALEFTYGHATSGPIEFEVCIDPVPLPRLERNKEIRLSAGGVKTITADYLMVVDNRGSPASALEYVVLSHPTYGVLFNEGYDDLTRDLSRFTQQDIVDGRIAYNHRNDKSNSVSDSFEFKVCTEYACTRPQNFTIKIYLAHLIVTNTGFTVDENGNRSITSSMLNVVAPEGYGPQVDILIPRGKGPKNGNLKLFLSELICPVNHFTDVNIHSRQLYYEHDGSETKHDSFEFTAQAIRNPNSDVVVPPGTPSPPKFEFRGIVNITIRPINNKPPRQYNFTKHMVVVEGGDLRITDHDLSYHDIDSDADDNLLAYQLLYEELRYGDLFLDGSMDPVTSWTEGDLRRGRLYYRHKYNVPRDDDPWDLVFFAVSDGVNQALEYLFIHIKPVVLQFAGQRPYTNPFLDLLEGGTGDITHRNLKYVAANDDSLTDADFLYNVTEGPVHGNLSFDGSTAGGFTQKDLLNASLIYEHDGSNTVEDSFAFTITVPSRKYVSEVKTFTIDIESVDDDPPVAYVQDPMFVVEWSNLTIDRSTLDIRDLDSTKEEKWVRVECTVIEPPRYGAIQRTELGGDFMNTSTFTLYNLNRRSVQYNHMKLSRGHWTDRFVFTVTDGINPQDQSYPVNIVILPHTLQLNASGLRVSVNENSAVQLRPENFQVLHPYLQGLPGKISVSAPPEHGSIVVRGTGSPVSEFRVEHLQSGAVSYQHDGNEFVEDGFNFTYNNLLPRGYERKTIQLHFVVEVLPVNDQPPSLVTHNLFIWMGERVVLGVSYLNATDLDTPLKQLVYSYTPFVEGHVEYAHAVGHPILNFSQDDVDAERVIFVHDSGLSANVTFSVTDGKYVAHGYILVSAERLMLRGGANSGASVPLGGVVSITRDYLDFYTNDHRSDISNLVPRPIYYQMASAMYGHVVVDSVQTSNFTQMDVNEGRVSYVHTAVDFWEPQDSLSIKVWTPLASPRDLTLEVDIELPHTPTSDLAVNEPVHVHEGGRFCFSERVLDARNLKYRTWLHYGQMDPLDQLVIEYNVTALPANGTLDIHGAQRTDLPVIFTQSELSKVCYRHDDSESSSDGFPFEVKIMIGITPLDTFFGYVNISVALQNDEIPQLVPTLPLNRTFVEGFTVLIGPTDLEVTDKDTRPEDIEYIVLGLPDNGDVIVWNEPIRIRERFSQRDVNTGRVKFRAHPGAHRTSNFVFTFSDGRHRALGNISFRIVVVPLVVSLVESAGLTYRQDKLGAEVTSDVLNAVTNGNREETSFVISREPSNGQLKRGDHVLHVGEFFTQEEVDGRRIRYSATNFAASNDSFAVDIKNQEHVLPNVTIAIHVGVWGQVRDDVIMDLGASTSGPLPRDLLDLSELQGRAKERLWVTVHTSPHYGHLEMNFNGNAAKRRQELLSFHYDDLQNGWVHYHWDADEVNSSLTSVTDSFTLIVYGGAAIQPGEATVQLTVIPPSSVTPPPTTGSPGTDPSDSPTPTTPTTPTEASGFPMYALVPILGVFLILLVIIVLVIVFCLSQQKRIRRKWGPKPSATTAHPYPWSVQPSLPPPVGHHHYDFDPMVGRASNHGEPANAEELSEYSEDVTTRHSPSPSAHRGSPLHRNPPLPRPRTASGRSNVSISVSHRSLSSRQSDVSEASSYLPHVHIRPLYHQVHRPIPIRPMLHSPVRRNGSREGTESGYLSPIRSLNQSTSSLPRPQGTGGSLNDSPSGATSGVDTLNSDNDSVSVSQSHLCAPSVPTASSPPTTTIVTATTVGPASTNSESAGPSDANANGCDPELMKLFRSSNPILKKPEYWV